MYRAAADIILIVKKEHLMQTLRILRHAIAASLMAGHVAEARALETKMFHLLPRRDNKYRRPPERTTGKSYRSNGKRECARRVAQIAAGRLRPENGLQVA